MVAEYRGPEVLPFRLRLAFPCSDPLLEIFIWVDSFPISDHNATRNEPEGFGNRCGDFAAGWPRRFRYVNNVPANDPQVILDPEGRG